MRNMISVKLKNNTITCAKHPTYTNLFINNLTELCLYCMLHMETNQ